MDSSEEWVRRTSTIDLLAMMDEEFVELSAEELDALQVELASRPSIQWLLGVRGACNELPVSPERVPDEDVCLVARELSEEWGVGEMEEEQEVISVDSDNGDVFSGGSS